MIRRNLHVDVNGDEQSATRQPPADAGDIADKWSGVVGKLMFVICF